MKAVISVISDLSTDMRVQKQALLLAESGWEVTLMAGKAETSLPSLA